MFAFHSSPRVSMSFSAHTARPMSQVYAGDRASSPKLASVMVRAAQLDPAVGYPSPRTMKCRGLEKSMALKGLGGS